MKQRVAVLRWARGKEGPGVSVQEAITLRALVIEAVAAHPNPLSPAHSLPVSQIPGSPGL